MPETWKTRLENADFFDGSQECEILRSDAGRWNSCALGERLGFPDVPEGDLWSAILNGGGSLYGLGHEFESAVCDSDRDRALSILAEINDPKYDGEVKSIIDRISSACGGAD